MKPERREVVAAGLAYSLLTALYLRMTPARFLGAIPPDQGDPLFVLTILRWVASRVPHFFSGVWSPTFFWPTRDALGLSDHLFAPGILCALLESLGWTPAAAYNSLLLAAFAGGALAAHLVLRRSGLSAPAAAFGAIAWSFSASRWAELSHLQVLFVVWIPWTLWSFDRLLAEATPRRAASFACAYALHVSGGAYLAYLIHLPLAAIAATRLVRRGAWPIPKRTAALWFMTALFSVALFLWLYLPYSRIRAEMGLVSPPSTYKPFLIHASNFLSVDARTIYYDLMPEALQVRHGALFIGFLSFGWLAYDVTSRWRQRRHPAVEAGVAEDGGWWLALAAVGIVSALACLSGVARALRDLLPGFEAIRVPSRLFVFASFAATAFAAAGFDRWLRSRPSRRAATWLATAVLLLAAVEGFPTGGPRGRSLRWIPVPAPSEIPPVYLWLATRNDVTAVAEIPLLAFWRESERMYYWTVHRKPLLNGYSGYVPLTYRKTQSLLRDFPTAEATRGLEALGMSHLIVHLDALAKPDRKRWREWGRELGASATPWLTLEAELGEAIVYRVVSRESR